MDDFWAVVWGASIALFASVIGGLLTSVVGPWLSRRAAKADRDEQAVAVAREAVRSAVQDVAIGMNNWLFAMGRGDQDGKKLAQHAVNEAQVALRMWTTHEERSLETSVYTVMGNSEVNEALVAVAAWEDQTARWFRGVLDADDFMSEFEEAIERNTPLAAKWRAAEEANAAEHAADSDVEPKASQ